jgi:hypothetical protein
MYYYECDDEDIEEYNNSSYEHGALGKVESQNVKVLYDAYENYDDMEYDVGPAKKHMFDFLKENKILDDSFNVEDFGFNCFNKTLLFKLRDEKLRDNTYLFNTETGEVYFINETLMKHINFDKYNDYNKVITGGIESALQVVSDIKLCIMCRSDNE